MTKRAHPVESFEQGIIARAEHFTAFVQFAPGDRHTIERKTQAEAEACARAMAAQCGKAILVYAVTKEGRSALAATIRPPEKDSPDMHTHEQTPAPKDPLSYSAKSAALHAARAALGSEAVAGIDFTLSQSGKRWTWAEPRKVEPRSFNVTEAPPKTAPGGSGARPPRKPPVTAPEAPRMRKSTAEAMARAEKGILPEPPDFSAETHTRFRPKLAELVALISAKDIAGLLAYPIKPVSTSPKALDRFRNLAVTALEAQASAAEIV